MYMDGGTTTQSKFVIPILTLQNIIHNIHQRNKLANLLKVTKLTIWNKISMTHKFCFEVMDKISIIMQILHIENMLLFRKLKRQFSHSWCWKDIGHDSKSGDNDNNNNNNDRHN